MYPYLGCKDDKARSLQNRFVDCHPLFVSVGAQALNEFNNQFEFIGLKLSIKSLSRQHGFPRKDHPRQKFFKKPIILSILSAKCDV